MSDKPREFELEGNGSGPYEFVAPFFSTLKAIAFYSGPLLKLKEKIHVIEYSAFLKRDLDATNYANMLHEKIEGLKAEIEVQLDLRLKDQNREIELQARNTKLVEALEKCAKPNTWHVPCPHCGEMIIEAGNYIAREALATNNKESGSK